MVILALSACAPTGSVGGTSATPVRVDPSSVAGCVPGTTVAIDGWVSWAGKPVAGAVMELRSYDPSGNPGQLFTKTTTNDDGYFYLTGVDATTRQDVVFVATPEYDEARKHVDMAKTCTVAHFGPAPNSFPVKKPIPALSIAHGATISSAAFTVTWEHVPPTTRYCMFLISLPEGRLMVPNDCRSGLVGANVGPEPHYAVPALPAGRYQLQVSGLLEGTPGSIAFAFAIFNVR